MGGRLEWIIEVQLSVRGRVEAIAVNQASSVSCSSLRALDGPDGPEGS